MPSVTPRIGSDLRVTVNRGHGEFSRTRVIDFDADYLYVSIPVDVESEREIRIGIDDVWQVSYALSPNDVYEYYSNVQGVVNRGVTSVRLTLPDKAESLTRIQRREFFRVPAHIEVKLSKHFDMAHPTIMRSTDISAGGLAVQSSTPPDFSLGDSAYVELNLAEIGFQLCAACKIVRVETVADGQTAISMRFENQEERQRQQLVRYTFLRQRAMRR